MFGRPMFVTTRTLSVASRDQAISPSSSSPQRWYSTDRRSWKRRIWFVHFVAEWMPGRSRDVRAAAPHALPQMDSAHAQRYASICQCRLDGACHRPLITTSHGDVIVCSMYCCCCCCWSWRQRWRIDDVAAGLVCSSCTCYRCAVSDLFLLFSNFSYLLQTL